MSKKNPGIKIPYFRADQYPVVEGLRCVEILIPDTIENMALLAGLLKLPGRAFNWQGDDEKRYELAQTWRNAYDATDWEQCMNCEELQACLQPLLDAQTELFQQMLDMSKYGTDARPGVPMTNSQKNADWTAGSNPTCDKNITWAQSLAVVRYGITLVTDALEIAESATNDTELAAAIGQLPGLDELGVDAIFGYIDLLLEGVAENFEAQVTEEYIEQAACAIFCQAEANCEINANIVYDVFKTRVLDHFSDPGEIWSTVNDMLAYLVDQDIDGTIIADTLLLLVFGGGLLANVFLGDVGTKSVETVARLAVDDASPDWEILCTECNSLCRATYDFGNQPLDLDVTVGTLNSFGFIESEVSSGTSAAVFECDQPHPGSAVRIRLYFSDNLPKFCQVVIGGVLYPVNGTPQPLNGLWALTFEVPVTNDGTLSFVLTRVEIGSTIDYFLMAVDVVYEC